MKNKPLMWGLAGGALAFLVLVIVLYFADKNKKTTTTMESEKLVEIGKTKEGATIMTTTKAA